MCVTCTIDYDILKIVSIQLIFYWNSNHGPPPLYFADSEYQMIFGLTANFLLSIVIKIYEPLSILLFYPSHDIIIFIF